MEKTAKSGNETAKVRQAHTGAVSIIKYEGDNNTFVWKHPIEDFHVGSQLIVHESQEAVLFRDGRALDLFGPGRHTLKTQSLPLLNRLYRLPTGDTDATFHSEIYFINLTTQMGVKWGTDTKVRVFDPMSGMPVSIGASGEFNIRVEDSRRILLKLVGTTSGLVVEQAAERSMPAMTAYFRSLIMTRVKSYLAGVIRQESINILEIDEHMEALSLALREKINEGLAEYGLTMPEFYIMRVVTPEDDPADPNYKSYMEMKRLFAQHYLGVEQERVGKATAEAARERILVEAQTEAQTKIIGAQAEAEVYRLQAEAEAAAMRMKGYTYQQETARQVGMEAMQNGITGGSGGSLGDVAGLGVALGAMGSVIGMTQEALNPLAQGTGQTGQAPGGWTCACGQTAVTGNFCPNCGAKRPDPKPAAWDCACGQTGNTGNFCGNCGAARPAQLPAVWNCVCGETGNSGNFCRNCGRKKGE